LIVVGWLVILLVLIVSWFHIVVLLESRRSLVIISLTIVEGWVPVIRVIASCFVLGVLVRSECCLALSIKLLVVRIIVLSLVSSRISISLLKLS